MKIIRWFLVLLCFAITSICMFIFPEKIVLHYDLKGNIDGEGSKYFCYVFPLIVLFTSFLMEIIIRKIFGNIKYSGEDNANHDIQKNIIIFEKISLAIFAIFNVINAFILYFIWSSSSKLQLDKIDSSGIFTIMLSFLLIFMGIIITKVKVNSLIGVRTKWSMYNDRTWEKSNYICGFCMIAVGFVSIIISLIIGGWISELILFFLIIIMSIISCIASYNEYCKEKEKENNLSKLVER